MPTLKKNSVSHFRFTQITGTYSIENLRFFLVRLEEQTPFHYFTNFTKPPRKL